MYIYICIHILSISYTRINPANSGSISEFSYNSHFSETTSSNQLAVTGTDSLASVDRLLFFLGAISGTPQGVARTQYKSQPWSRSKCNIVGDEIDLDRLRKKSNLKRDLMILRWFPLRIISAVPTDNSQKQHSLKRRPPYTQQLLGRTHR